MEVVKVNPKEFGIEENKAHELLGNLPQIKSERLVLEQSYNEVLKMDIESPETSKKARELRLKIRDNRTKGIAVWHRTTKDVFLRGGQFVDAIKRQEEAVNERMESNLEKIEDYAEIQEKKRREELKDKRVSELEIYAEFVPFGIDLGAMNDEEYQKIFNGAKLQFDAKIEAEKKAELERIEKERIEAERIAEEKRIEAEKIEAQRLENERLKAEAEEREKALVIERKKAEAERKRLAEIQAKKDAENAEKLRKEREEKERIEKELKAEKERQAQIEAQRIAEIEAERKEAEKLAKAPIKRKMSAWIETFSHGESPNENETAKEILAKFESFKRWAKSEIDKM
jgi:colicin import membrane protein